MIRSVIGSSVVWNPVATTRTSTSRSVPSAVTIPVGVTRAIRSVTSSVLSASRAGYQVLLIRIRLQPIMKSGVTFSRSAGSVMPFRMLASAIFWAGIASLGMRVKAGT